MQPIAMERVDKHFSVEMDSWKPTRYGTTFPWIRMINKRSLRYEIEDVFSVGPSLRYTTGASQIERVKSIIERDQNGHQNEDKSDQNGASRRSELS
jgi:hypothetical protein